MRNLCILLFFLFGFTICKAQPVLYLDAGGGLFPTNCATDTIYAGVLGGTPPYTFSFGGAFSATDKHVYGTAGTYVVTAMDATGATATSSITLETIIDSIVSVPSLCGASYAVYGANIFNISVIPNTVSVSSFGPNWTITNNLSTAQTYTVTSTGGCFSSLNTYLATFVASPGVAITPSVISTNSCPSYSSGSLTVTNVTGGTTPYFYSLNGAPYNLSTFYPGLSAGVYTITAQDANGCIGNTAVNIFSNLITTVSSVVGTTCTGSTATTIFSGANPPFTITYSNAQGTLTNPTSPNGDTIYNLLNGTYDVTVMDVTGCFVTQTITVNGTPSIDILSAEITHASCLNDGEVGLNINGGTAPYTYNWNTTPVQTSAIATGLSAGTYIATVTDANGCSGSTSINIMPIVFSVSASQDSVCPGGFSTLTAKGFGNFNTSQNPNNYSLQGSNSWSPSVGLNQNFGTQVIANPMVTTTYTVITTDTNVCNDTAYVTVFVKNGLLYSTAATIKTDASCPLSTDGNISVTETPITGSLNYLWNTGNTTATISNINAGIYSVLVSDTAGGCILLRDTIVGIGLNCGNIAGYVKYDSNNNCLYDPGEAGIPNTMITVNPGNHITFTNATGNYAINGLPYNTYTITKSNAFGYTNLCGNTTTGPINAAIPTLVGNYVDSSSLVYDYELNAWGGCLVPAVGNNHTSIYYNHNQAGKTSMGTIYAVFDSISHYGSSIPAHSSISGDTVFWNISNIQNSSNFIDVTWNLNPSLLMGLTITLSIGIINTQHVDSVMSNNTLTLNNITCTGIDPNEKYVVPQGKTNNGYITTADADLLYTVKFQNTGNATAANVVITDTISAFLDITKFHVLNASHPYSLEVVNNNVLKFKFLGIMLPDSNQDFEGSNGHITFGLKQLPNLAVGSVINNTANIYFDYNAPIVTGTTVNTIYKELQAAGNSSQANTACNVSCGNGKVTINGTDGIAPFTYSISPMCSTTTIVGNIVQNVPAGNYTTTITDALGKVVSNSASVQNNTATIAIASAVITPITSGTPGSISIVPTGGTAPYSYNWQPGNSTSSTLSTTVGGLYTCTITDANGCEKVVSYTIINNALGVSEITKATNLNLYPNPASTVLNIEASTALEQVRILNMVGKTIQIIEVGAARKTTIDIAALSAGVYQVQMSNGAVRKFVVGK
jgi:large repetitive protein